jgi:hypothetical protein
LSIRITAVELSGGRKHEHIVRLWWKEKGTDNTGDWSRATLVDWIENKGGKAYVKDNAGNRVDVKVVDPGNGRPKYVQTQADGIWTDNLLALAK